MWSPWIIAELNRVLTWHWLDCFGSSRESRERCSYACKLMMEALIPVFDVTTPVPPYPSAWGGLNDYWDKPNWAAAQKSEAHYVISRIRGTSRREVRTGVMCATALSTSPIGISPSVSWN